MVYSVIASVKGVLNILDSDDDVELTDCIVDADSQINTILGTHITVPVSPTPTEIGQISGLWAAGIFRNRRSSKEGNEFIKEAKERLTTYLEATYGTSSGPGTFTGSGGLLDDAGTDN